MDVGGRGGEHEGHNRESQFDSGSHMTAWVSEDGPGWVPKGFSVPMPDGRKP